MIMADLGDEHRLFLQMLMHRKICKATEIWSLYKLACETNEIEVAENDKSQLSAFVNKINVHVRPLHMEIKKGVCEVTGAHYYALINTADTSLSKLSSDYSVLDLELYKKLVEKIVLSDDGTVSSVDALNLTSDLEKKMTKKDGDAVIARFTKDQWLIQCGYGELSLGTRALIELEPYLRRVFPEDLIFCHMCRQIVLKGNACNRCTTKLHLHCAQRCFQGKNRCVCPQCGNLWPHARN